MIMESLVEQRSSPRVSVNIPAKLVSSIDRYFMVQIESLNENGFLCVSKKSLPLQTRVKLVILLPKQGTETDKSLPVHGLGVVVREHLREESGETRYAVAIKFSDLGAEETTHLKQFISIFYSLNG